MKKLNLLSLLMMLMTLISCSSDDEPQNLASETAGSYTGYTIASSQYFSDMVSIEQTVTLSASGLNKINIKYISDTWGTITINDAELSGGSNNISIKGSGKSMMSHAGDVAQEYDCRVEGALTGKELTLTFFCPKVMNGLKIEFRQGEISVENIIPGTYNGYTEAESAYFSGMLSDSQKIVITKNPDSTYKVAYSSEMWGETTIEAATAQYSDGKFVISGNGTTKMGMNGDIKEYDCSFDGTIDAAKKNPTFTFSVPTAMGGLSIKFNSGDMPSTNK